MLDSNYQKRGDLAHPRYYHYADNLENLAAGDSPVKLWMSEKADWNWNVQKTPSLARYEYSPNWNSNAYKNTVLGTNGYKLSDHYTNIVNKQHWVIGMAHMTQNSPYRYVDAYNATNKDAKSAISLAKYKSLIKQWLAQ